MSHQLSLSYGCPRQGVPARVSFERWLMAAARAARIRRVLAVSIRLVDSEEAQSLNRSYRGRDYATNVLSFPAQLPAEAGVHFLGDIALCAPVIAREANEQRKPLRDHYAHLCIHGVLHLLGYDHELDEQAKRMEALEVRALAALGIADPYESSTTEIGE